MPRNIIVCCDGTNNEFGPRNTNVVRLIQALDRNPRKQRMYYDPGLGTLPEPGVWTSFGKEISKVFGLAFGSGLSWKVGEAYSYLMNFWDPGDSVYIFGFSRGAYTARVLAGLLHQLGLLPRGNQNLVPYVMRLFRGARAGGFDSHYWRLCDDFRRTFSRLVPGTGDERRFTVRFLGLWDTVSSVGWAWDPVRYPFTMHNPGVEVIRHAVSIDERRAFFRQNLMEKTGDQDLTEAWFPGVHCDVGGGYTFSDEERGLWWLPFEWILGEAGEAGLLVNKKRMDVKRKMFLNAPRPWLDEQHESLTPVWWLAEVFPKMVRLPGTSMDVPWMNLGRHRAINDGALIHRSALMRMRDSEYAPPNISGEFRGKVRSLRDVPEYMPYEKGDGPGVDRSIQPAPPPA